MKYRTVLDIDRWEFEINGKRAVVVNDGEYLWDCWKEDFDMAWHSEIPQFDLHQIERDGLEWLVYNEFCDKIDYLRETDPESHVAVVAAMSAEFGVNCENWNWI